MLGPFISILADINSRLTILKIDNFYLHTHICNDWIREQKYVTTKTFDYVHSRSWYLLNAWYIIYFVEDLNERYFSGLGFYLKKEVQQYLHCHIHRTYTHNKYVCMYVCMYVSMYVIILLCVYVRCIWQCKYCCTSFFK